MYKRKIKVLERQLARVRLEDREKAKVKSLNAELSSRRPNFAQKIVGGLQRVGSGLQRMNKGKSKYHFRIPRVEDVF